MSTAYYDYSVDPVTNQIYPVILRSASKGGTTTLKIGVVDVNVPAAANFPSSFTTSTPSRYFIDLPMDAYWTSTNTAGFSVRNETQGRALTVVTPVAALTDYTCKFGSSSAEKKSILEVHVGSTSNMANDLLSYEGYFSGNVLKSTSFDYLYVAKFHPMPANNSITVATTASTEIDTAKISIHSTNNFDPAITFLNTNNSTLVNRGSGNSKRYMSIQQETGALITGYANTGAALSFQGNYSSASGSDFPVTFKAYEWSTASSNYANPADGKNLASFGVNNDVSIYNGGRIDASSNIKTPYGVATAYASSYPLNSTLNSNLQLQFGPSTNKPRGWHTIYFSTSIGSSFASLSTALFVATDGTSWYYSFVLTRA